MLDISVLDKQALMLELEEMAQIAGLRNFAKLGSELSISSKTQLLIDTKADDNDVVKHNGSVALTANWLAGYKITAAQIASSIAVGTAPLEVVSTTVVTNLNADLLDGVHSSALEPTVTKGNLTAGSNKISIGGTGTGSVIGAGVTVDVAQSNLDHGSIGGLSDDDHTQYVKHSLATAVSDFLVGAGTSTFTFVKKTLAEVKTILGLGSAAYTASTDYAVSGKGVTNGDSHDHVGGDGSQIDHGGLGGNSDDDHSQYLRVDAARALSADWDIGNGRMIQTDKIRARDADGLALYEDGGAGIFVKDGGSVGIGTTGPSSQLEVAKDQGNAEFRMTSYYTSESAGLGRFRKARGTQASPTIVANNDLVGFCSFQGYDGTNFTNAATIWSYVDGTPGANDMPGRLIFGTTPDGGDTSVERLTILNGGNVGIGTTAPSAKLAINGGLHVGGDSDPGDNNLLVDGKVLVPEIKTDTATPTDLTITTGAAKTLVLATPVYKDENIAGILLGKPASSYPGIDTFRDLNGTDTTINTYAFAIDEYVSCGFELQHDYKEATDIVFHVHWQGIAAPGGGTDNVQWRLTYTIARDGVTLAAATTIDSPDVAIDTRYRSYRNDFAAIVGTNLKIGDQLMFNLYRVAAVSDDYAGDCLIQTAGIHYQVDTLGSRVIITK